ncbi:hypothetical protein LUZ61_006757 [Rhynchospora tenuis]|uniref:Uncharacterized protein n=1 Tax=Rhynchospora tenuis TaxID=198213 RepID=A0AAD5ZS30_9POAL|nr:hypothetical protein LUZ61_006757 [Rhynchospora tenuis]
MDLPDSDSWESTPMAEALVQNINPAINPILVEAVQNPELRSMVLSMECFVQRFVQTNFQHVKFPSLSNPYLRAILSLLALHYGIRSVCIEGTSLIGKRIPHSQTPSDTLSSIPAPQPEDEMSDNSKFIETSTNLKRQTGGASSSNLNLNQTYPWPDAVMERTFILDVSNLQDQPVAYPTSIPQSQLMQHGASVSKPALPPHGESASPYTAGNFLCDPSVDYMQLMQGLVPLSQETLQYQPTITYSGFLQDVLASASQPPADPNRTSVLPSTYNQLPPLQYGTSTAGPSGPPLHHYGQSASPSTLAPQFHSYNPVNSTYTQLPMPQSRQPFSLEQMLQPRPAQPPSTSVAFQIQRENNETGRLQRLVPNARQLM